jgi:hypothetical protein
MASAGLHTSVIIRRLADGERIDRFRGSMAGGRLAFSPDATLLLDMGSLGGWALHSGPTVIYHIPFRGRAYSVHAGSDGLPFTAGCAVSPDTASFALTLVRTPADKPGDHLQVRDLASGRRLAGFRTGPMEGWDGAGAIALGWHPDGRRLVAAGMDGMLYVCELPGSGAPSMSGDRNE